jgi:hypothetical protein
MYDPVTAKGQKYQPGLCVDRQQVTGPLLHFVRTRLLMLFDPSSIVLVERATCDKPCLRMAGGGKLINEEGRLFVLDQNAIADEVL